MSVDLNAPGQKVMLMGNEAIARGAIEAGAAICAAYPGNPSSEIIGTLSDYGPRFGMHVEWSANEKVAMETAAGAAFAGLRGLCAMKQNGLNVATDFLFNVNLTGVRGGLVVVVCDDPGAISSTNEQDSRLMARIGDLPLLEPADSQEAKDLTLYAFELSEAIGAPVILRSTTRVSHARGQVKLGPLPGPRPKPWFDKSQPFITLPALVKHQALKDKLAQAAIEIDRAGANYYAGPDSPQVVIVAAGVPALYAREAIQILGLADRVGLLKLGSTWPLPEEAITAALARAERCLVCEEIDTVLETHIQALACRRANELGLKQISGRLDGLLPALSELSTDLVMAALAKLLDLETELRSADYAAQAAEAVADLVPARQVGFCAGCPHRATMWGIKTALALDDREGVLIGDIGCYSMSTLPTGFGQMKTLHAMGSGPGVAGGLGQLTALGLDQPIITAVGDSTFYHAALPALVNARYNQADFLMLVLDNSATAMTGFQPHPGTGSTAEGGQAPVVDIDGVCRALGFTVEVVDPFDLPAMRDTLLRLMAEPDGVKVLIVRQTCALVRSRERGKLYNMTVDPDLCRGEECGCDRLCTRIFKCPGLVWDREAQTTRLDEAVCTGCGVCADICPAGAITKEAV